MKNIRYYILAPLLIPALLIVGILILCSGCGGSTSPNLPAALVATPAPTPSPTPVSTPTPTPAPTFQGACLKPNMHFQTANGGCQDKTYVLSKIKLEAKSQADAIASCENLNESGFTDWRLPYVNDYRILALDSLSEVVNVYSASVSALWVWTADITGPTGDRVFIADGGSSGVLISALYPYFCIRDATAL